MRSYHSWDWLEIAGYATLAFSALVVALIVVVL